MLRCIELGKKGLGKVAPNPMVGSVVVNDGKIIGEGFTSPYGGAHAEVNAIGAVSNQELLKSSTLYVTLEPCSHFGKTPPCADLIVQKNIPRVVIGLQDPHDKVAGRGIQKLKAAGCEVTLGVLEADCREHHKRFLSIQEKKRPYIVLKWAETKDGFIAPEQSARKNNPEPFWISNGSSKQLVHQWRGEEQAILVGTNTVLADNPKLSTRNWSGKNPIRIVLDRNLRIPAEFNVLDGSIKTHVLTAQTVEGKSNSGVQYHFVEFTKNLPQQICNYLFSQSITSLLIEGGRETLQSFIDANLWDEARVFTGKAEFGSGVKSPTIYGHPIDSKNIISDTLTVLRND